MTKSLDTKLAEIKANRASRAFILADAKDADMALDEYASGLHHRAHRARLSLA